MDHTFVTWPKTHPPHGRKRNFRKDIMRVFGHSIGVRGSQGGSRVCGNLSGDSLVEGEQLAKLHLDEVDELRIIDSVALVEEADHGGNTDLAREHRQGV
jgi:hypothetical protein